MESILWETVLLNRIHIFNHYPQFHFEIYTVYGDQKIQRMHCTEKVEKIFDVFLHEFNIQKVLIKLIQVHSSSKIPEKGKNYAD